MLEKVAKNTRIGAGPESAPADRNFDDLAERFARNIYGGAKGAIRLAVVREQLRPLLEGPPLRVLDAGCGFGQLGLEFLERGHRVLFNDLSATLLGHAREAAGDHPRARFVHGPLQRLDPALGPFDLILFHAVLEWLAEPRPTLERLVSHLAPGGHLSLMFYNRDALVYRNLLQGNWRKVERGDWGGHRRSLTPHHPLTLEEVEPWLEACGLTVEGRAGVRVLHDYLRPQLRRERPEEALIELELRYCRHPAYLRLGRYIHLLARRR